ncbi:MAG: YceI family protein [Rhodobacteraceae bacterium]|jgi:polyisoprenoid-binding protein YceI|nr:YceI family protein [Paracoccaceae bacterium]
MIRATALALMLTSPVIAQDLPPPPAGSYRMDLGHTRLLFQVNHIGVSNYIALFTEMDATLEFNPDAPETMTLTATVNPASVETHYPDPEVDFNALVAGPEFLDSAQFPEITFTSTAVTLTGENTADVTGDFTLHGVTLPLTLQVTYNGGYGANDFDPGGARIGFSATGSLLRSAHGIGYGVPAPGTEFGVGDAVNIIIETEFSNPDAKAP